MILGIFSVYFQKGSDELFLNLSNYNVIKNINLMNIISAVTLQTYRGCKQETNCVILT